MPQTPFPTKPARRGPPPLSYRIAPKIAALAKASGAMDPALAEAWPEIVGKEIAALCRPVRLKRLKGAAVLEVSVSSGAAAMRVQYAQNQILARARTRLGMTKLTKLAVRQSGTAPTQDRRWHSRRVTLDEAPPAPPVPKARNVAEALERLGAAMKARAE